MITSARIACSLLFGKDIPQKSIDTSTDSTQICRDLILEENKKSSPYKFCSIFTCQDSVFRILIDGKEYPVRHDDFCNCGAQANRKVIVHTHIDIDTAGKKKFCAQLEPNFGYKEAKFPVYSLTDMELKAMTILIHGSEYKHSTLVLTKEGWRGYTKDGLQEFKARQFTIKQLLFEKASNSQLPIQHQLKERDVTITRYAKPDKFVWLRPANKGLTCWIASCVELLYCAHERSKKKLFDFGDDLESLPLLVAQFHVLMNEGTEIDKQQIWDDFLDALYKTPEFAALRDKTGDSGQFYSTFIPYVYCYMRSDLLKSFRQEVKEQDCYDHTRARTYETDTEAFFLRYTGEDDISKPGTFTEEWKKQFEGTFKCYQCGHERGRTTYFLQMAKFLFVLVNGSMSFVINACKNDFEVEKPISTSYALIGASIHIDSTTNVGHYLTLASYEDDDDEKERWYECNDDEIPKPTNVQDFSKYSNLTAQLLLFHKMDVIKC